MALDFPANPVDGEVYGSYVWSEAKNVWLSREESAAVTIISPIAPATANSGDLWFNSSIGILFAYYSDGSSEQWVEVVSSGILDISSKADKTYVDSQDITKANINSPNFTGTVSLPSTTSIGNVSSAELGHVDGVTSSIQTQLNNKAASSHTHAASDVNSGTFTYDRMPAGTVIQSTNTKYTPLAVTGSNSFVNFTSVNFTPRLSNSLVLIQAMFSTSHGMAIQVRNTAGTAIFSPVFSFHVYAQSGGPDYGAGTIRIPYFLQCTDLPGTTATRTYYFDFRAYAGTVAVNEGGNGVSSITITEIKQ
jgi:hypothetical protein